MPPQVVVSSPVYVGLPVVLSDSSQLASTLPRVILPPAVTAENQTFLLVKCPHEAEVRIDGYFTRSTGPSRVFRLSTDQPHLPRQVTVTLNKAEDGKLVIYERTEMVTCQTGRTTTLNVPMKNLMKIGGYKSKQTKATKDNQSAALASWSGLLNLQLQGDVTLEEASILWELAAEKSLLASLQEQVDQKQSAVTLQTNNWNRIRQQRQQTIDDHQRMLNQVKLDSSKVSIDPDRTREHRLNEAERTRDANNLLVQERNLAIQELEASRAVARAEGELKAAKNTFSQTLQRVSRAKLERDRQQLDALKTRVTTDAAQVAKDRADVATDRAQVAEDRAAVAKDRDAVARDREQISKDKRP